MLIENKFDVPVSKLDRWLSICRLRTFVYVYDKVVYRPILLNVHKSFMKRRLHSKIIISFLEIEILKNFENPLSCKM